MLNTMLLLTLSLAFRPATALSQTPAPTRCIPYARISTALANSFARGIDAFSGQTGSGQIITTKNYSMNKTAVIHNCLRVIPNVMQTIDTENLASCTWFQASATSASSSYNSFMVSSSESLSASLGLAVTPVKAFGSTSSTRIQARAFASKNNATFFSIRHECEVASTSLVSPALWDFTPSFLLDFGLLPTSYTLSSNTIYVTFFSKYGTHMYTSGKLGGRFEGVFASQTCSWSDSGYSSNEVASCIGGGLRTSPTVRAGAEMCVGSSVSSSQSLSVSQVVGTTWASVIGGDSSTFQNTIQAFVKQQNMAISFATWFNSLETTSAVMIKGSAAPLHDILIQLAGTTHPQIQSISSAAQRAQALKSAFDSLVSSQNQDENTAPALHEPCGTPDVGPASPGATGGEVAGVSIGGICCCAILAYIAHEVCT